MSRLRLTFCAAAIALLACGTAALADEPIKRTILETIDFPNGYTTILAKADVTANSVVARHTHPGLEIGTCVAGEFDLIMEGKPTVHIKTGDHYQIPAALPHEVHTGAVPMTVIATYIIEKGKPLATPAPK